MNSFSCAIFFSRTALSASMRERICVLLTNHVVVAADVHDYRFIVDIGDMGADAIQKVPDRRKSRSTRLRKAEK